MANEEMLQFKGKPLVRSGKFLYYGNPAEKYVAMLQILSTKDDDLKSADRVIIQVLSTDDTLEPKDRIIKKGTATSLYESLFLASNWLSRALSAS